MRRQLGLEDLKDVHPEIYNSLKRLLVHEGDVAEMGLYFQVPHHSSSPAGFAPICSAPGAHSVESPNGHTCVYCSTCTTP